MFNCNRRVRGISKMDTRMKKMNVGFVDGILRPVIGFWVPGDPQQKGSKKAFIYEIKGVPPDAHWRSRYRANIVDENRKEAIAWENKIKTYAMEFRPRIPWECAVRLDVRLYMPWPKSVKRKYHTVKPDRDKLLRCVQDALTGLIYKDDAQVIDGITSKEYSTKPGADIMIYALGDTYVQEKLL